MFTNDYVVGLVDGEGSFTVYVCDRVRSRAAKRRVRVEPRFYLKLVAHDREILEALQRFFGCGNVYFQKDNRKNHQHCYRFEVTNRHDLNLVIIPFFRKNLPKFPSKRKDFDIFCDLMERINRGEHLTDRGLETLYRIKQQMH